MKKPCSDRLIKWVGYGLACLSLAEALPGRIIDGPSLNMPRRPSPAHENPYSFFFLSDLLAARYIYMRPRSIGLLPGLLKSWIQSLPLSYPTHTHIYGPGIGTVKALGGSSLTTLLPCLQMFG